MSSLGLNPGVLQAMARPGYSWRVGVFPPSKPKAELSEIELRILEKITQPALMMVGSCLW